MRTVKIGIVEDEAIVAEDLRQMVSGLGYDVVGLAATAEEAYALAKDYEPDLILMDIRIRGEKDGIDAAEQITTEFNIPVTFVTAFADDVTLERAKATLPYGYIVKPFEEKELRASIKVALHRHHIQEALDGMDEWHSAAIRQLPWGVLTTDRLGKINYVNASAENLLGKRAFELIGKMGRQYFPLTPLIPQGHAIAHTLQLENKETPIVFSQVALKGADPASSSGMLIIFHSAVP